MKNFNSTSKAINACFNNSYQHSLENMQTSIMHKIVTQTEQGRNLVDFKANVKSVTAPVIVDTITGDDGEESYVLENGNTFPKEKYDALWFPSRGKMNLHSKFKGNPIGSKKY
jgi:hypothetical protein